MAKISETLEDYKANVMGSLGYGTCKIYIRAVGRLVKDTGDKEAEALTIKDFANYKMGLAKAKRSSSYIAGEIAAFCSYLEFLKKTYNIRPVHPEDLRDLRPRVRPGDPTPLEPWQYQLLIENAETIEDRTLIEMLFHTGLRIDELLSLTKDSLVERQYMHAGEGAQRVKWLKVIGKGNKERSIPLNGTAKEALDRLMLFLDMKYPKGYSRLFPKSYTTAWRQVKTIGKRAGIDVHPHSFRHTFATELLKAGENIVTIARIMGHESLDTTKKYTKIVDTALVDAVRRLE